MNIDVQRPERAQPIGVFLYAESFLRSAQALSACREDGTLSLRFEDPIYYLYTHSVELFLKSFLRAKGYSEAKLSLKPYGHDLSNLWLESINCGLAPHPVKRAIMEQTIEILAPFATSYEFRYLATGAKTIPTLDALGEAATYFMDAVKPICLASLQNAVDSEGLQKRADK